METRRRQIVDLLTDRAISLQELANHFRVPMTVILEDMDHVKKTIKGTADLNIQPSECKGCGYTFDERSKIKRPSRCPRCKHERITPPIFKIKQRKHLRGND